MRTYAHHFTGDGSCEAQGCEVRPFFLFPTQAGRSLVRACCPAHAADAEAALRHNEHRASVESARP